MFDWTREHFAFPGITDQKTQLLKWILRYFFKNFKNIFGPIKICKIQLESGHVQLANEP